MVPNKLHFNNASKAQNAEVVLKHVYGTDGQIKPEFAKYFKGVTDLNKKKIPRRNL